jgi:transcription initiation factor TFIIH subunit 4
MMVRIHINVLELIAIDEDFKRKVREVISEGVSLSLLKESRKTNRKFAAYNSRSLKKFDSILSYLINQPNELSANQKNLLFNLGLISNHGRQSITEIGFKFLLSDRPSQINQLIIQYVEYAKSMKANLPALFTLLFNLHLTLHEKLYVFRSDENDYAVYESFLNDLEELGLIYQKKRGVKDAEKPKRIMKSDLLNMWQEEIPPKEIKEEDKFLIVESNFRYMAYTSSPYHRSLLSLFSAIDYEFPTRIIGSIDSETVIMALKKGITAEQICFYLRKHGRYQIEAEGVDPKLSVIPENVLEQIKLWEKDLHCLTCQGGNMITGFDTEEKYKRFVAIVKSDGKLVYASSKERTVVCNGTSAEIRELYLKI